MKKYLVIIISIFLVSCNTRNPVVTEKEVNAVQQVLNFYNGECVRNKGIEIKNGTKIRSFELVMRKSDLLEHDTTKLQFHSGNIAYLFYSNLMNEKANYDKIDVRIDLANGASQAFSYTDKELVEIEHLQPQLDTIIKTIQAKDYDSFVKQFDSSVPVDKSNVEKMFSSLESKLGKFHKAQFQGFEFSSVDEIGEIIVIREAAMFDKMGASMMLIFKRKSQTLISLKFP